VGTTHSPGNVKEPGLERTGKRLGRSAGWFLAVALAIAIPGIVLVIIDSGVTFPVGVAVLLIASIPGVIGLGLLVSGVVSRWSARHRSFA
jgi:hypothetical protein